MRGEEGERVYIALQKAPTPKEKKTLEKRMHETKV